MHEDDALELEVGEPTNSIHSIHEDEELIVYGGETVVRTP